MLIDLQNEKNGKKIYLKRLQGRRTKEGGQENQRFLGLNVLNKRAWMQIMLFAI